jgi:hypothetical protein
MQGLACYFLISCFVIHTTFLLENVKEMDRSGDVGVDGRIILEWILGNGCIWLGIGNSGGRALMNTMINIRFPQKHIYIY